MTRPPLTTPTPSLLHGSAVRTATRRTGIAALVVVLSAAGCSASVESTEPTPSTDVSSTPSAPPASTPAPSTPAAPVPSASGTASGKASSKANASGTWLYDVPSQAERASGQRTDADLAGDGTTERFAHSTTQWAGCDGAVDVTSYVLKGRYDQLTGRVAMREGSPKGLVAEIQFDVDGSPVSRIRVEADGGAPVQVVLTDFDTLTVTAKITEGACDDADESYLVLADTSVN